MDNTFLILLILVLILIIILYLFSINNSSNNTTNNNLNHNNTNTHIDTDKLFNNNSLYIKANREEDIKIDVQGYTNELMYTSENLKDGDYVNQFVPIDFSKIPKPNNQIGFNPEPKCSYGELPFANVNVNYLLKNC